MVRAAGAPVVVELDAVARLHAFEHGEGGVDHFDADAVAGEHYDIAVILHERSWVVAVIKGN